MSLASEEHVRKLVVAIDSGTQSTRAIVYEHESMQRRACSRKFSHELICPKEAWSEHQVREIEVAVVAALCDVLKRFDDDCQYEIVSIGITNQRETIVAWDVDTGELLNPNSICWNDGRTTDWIEQMRKTWSKSQIKDIEEKTGLFLNSYYSGSKMRWMIDNIPAVEAAAEAGSLRFGTIDSFIIYRLTNQKCHVTDVSNASRTLLFDIHKLKYDEGICDLFGIPMSSLPKVMASAAKHGRLPYDFEDYALRPRFKKLPKLLQGVMITGVIGDQQAATLGHNLFFPGDAKLTFGSGGFLLMNCGTEIEAIPSGCTVSPLFQIEGEQPFYSVEGSIAHAGMGITWLKKNQLVALEEIDTFIETTTSSEGCFFVPAFSGLLSPWWNEDLRATIAGMTLKTERRHIVRAFLESLAVQVCSILDAMEKTGCSVTRLFMDGGLSQSDSFLQIISDFSRATLHRPPDCEMTARGAAYVAVIGVDENPAKKFEGMMASTESDNKKNNIYATKFQPSEKSADVEYALNVRQEWLRLVDHLADYYKRD